MSLDPRQQSCLHLATPQERQRDPGYQACTAQPGEPCTWARRYDGVADPLFHSERLELCVERAGPAAPLDRETLREALLATGLV